MCAQINKTSLSRKWVHSHEEDTDSEMVFRPADYKFPPSRGRVSYDLKSDGSLGHTGIGADDRRAMSEGRWQLKDDDLLLSTGAPGSADQSMKILSVSNDKLVLKK